MARQVSVSHMFVHRIWKKHRVTPFSSPPPSALPAHAAPDRVFVDIVGVYHEPAGRLAVFEVAEASWVGSSFLVAPPETGPIGISGGLSVDRREVFARYLLPLLGALEAGRTEKPRPPSTHDLLIFLRALDYMIRPSSDLWIVSQGIPLGASRCLRDWLQQRPRFRVHSADGADGWEREIRRWASTRLPGQMHPSSFPNVSACHSSIARCLSEGRERFRPFAWTPTFDSLRGWGPGGEGGSADSIVPIPRLPRGLEGLSFTSH